MALRSVFELVCSEEILAELRSKLSGNKFGFSDVNLDRVDLVIRNAATLVKPETRLSVLEDRPDNRILECAVSGAASAIVTDDRHFLTLKNYEEVGIMTVADLLYTFPQ